MNKLIKISILIIGVVFFTSCEKDIPEREASPVANSNATNVYFPKDYNPYVVMSPTTDTFNVYVFRAKTSSAQTVKITNANLDDGGFEIPSSVKFEAGDSIAKLQIKGTSLEMFKLYRLELYINPEEVNPYDTLDYNSPTLLVQVIKEDYTVVETGTFSAGLFGGESWKQNLEFSEIQQKYRLKNLYAKGFDIYFKWDKKAKVTMNKSDQAFKHSKYGIITANWLKDGDKDVSRFDESTRTFTFEAEFTASDGSFGEKVDTFVLN